MLGDSTALHGAARHAEVVMVGCSTVRAFAAVRGGSAEHVQAGGVLPELRFVSYGIVSASHYCIQRLSAVNQRMHARRADSSPPTSLASTADK